MIMEIWGIGQGAIQIVHQATVERCRKTRCTQWIPIHIAIIAQNVCGNINHNRGIFVGYKNDIAPRDRGILNRGQDNSHRLGIDLGTPNTRSPLITDGEQECIMTSIVGASPIGHTVECRIDIGQRTAKNHAGRRVCATGKGQATGRAQGYDTLTHGNGHG